MSAITHENVEDDSGPLTLKFETIDDYMNNSPLSDIDAEFEFNSEEAKLIFHKPVFDMAIIITHSSLVSEICELQNFFQSKYGLTTHCIFLPDMCKLKLCIRDLKMEQIIYAIVVNQNGLIDDIMDLYILYPIIEIQKKMNRRDLDELVGNDFENFTQQIQSLKCNPMKNPHPMNDKKELFDMNDELRYHLCLLSDNRMLSMDELLNLRKYLNQRKIHLEKVLASQANLFEDRPLEARRQEKLKYFIYEPISNENTILQRPVIPVIPQNNSINFQDASRPLIKFNIASNVSISPSPYQPPMKYPSHSIYEQPIIHKAKLANKNFSNNLQKIKSILFTRGRIIPISYEIVQGGVLKNQISKKNDSQNVEYAKSNYISSQHSLSDSEDIISLSSGSGTCTPPMEYDLIPVTPPNCQLNSMKAETGKRKLETDNLAKTNSIPKLHKIDLRKPGIDKSQSYIINSPDVLLNLFRLILNTVPYDLPHDNSILNILINYCNDVQNGIMEPSLKIVKIDYESCKMTGANEIFKSIYGIYEVAEKSIDDISDIQYIWKKYFPDHLSNFNLLVVFYKFIKMLIIFRLFNSQSDRLKIILNTVEKLNTIVNFDFQKTILLESRNLSCISELFSTTFENHSELHSKYFDLPHLSTIPLTNKKLDGVYKKKKIEFILGPLLTYFINSLNSIHQQLSLIQAEMVYKAIRTLRYCLRVIYPINSPATIFNAPKIFSETAHGFKDIQDEIKWLLDELKYYQCVLFTEKHYEFVNCLLDFSFMIEGIIDSDSSVSRSSNDTLIVLDAVQFIESFATFESMDLQYHPETDISFLKNFLKESWIHILQRAFRGMSTDGKGKRIIKEINNLLPVLWGLKTFDEAVSEAAKLNYTEWTKIAQSDPLGWYDSFSKVKFAGIVWLNTNQLPLAKAVEELQKYENMLRNEFLHPSP